MSELVSTAVIFGESANADCIWTIAINARMRTRRSINIFNQTSNIKHAATSRYRHDAPACVHPVEPALPRPSLPAIIVQHVAGSFPRAPSLRLRPLALALLVARLASAFDLARARFGGRGGWRC